MVASSIVLTNSTGARRGLLLTTSLVSSLIMLDSNVVAVSLPTVARSLGAPFTDIQWVISAYVLTYAALLPAAGHYADLRERRRAMLVGLMVFAVSSAVCGAGYDACHIEQRACGARHWRGAIADGLARDSLA
jgi:MFS family permease